MYYYSIQVGEQFSNVSLVEVSFQLAKIYWLTWAVLQISIPEKTQFSLDRNCGSHHMHVFSLAIHLIFLCGQVEGTHSKMFYSLSFCCGTPPSS